MHARGGARTQRSRLRPRPRPRTQKNFQAKDRPSRGQGQGHRRTCSPNKKKRLQNFFGAMSKKGLKKFFSGEKGLQKFFFRRSSLEENKKRFSQTFREASGAFEQNFNGSKIGLSSSQGQANFRGLEASRPRPRTSKRVLEDSTSDACNF